MFLYYMYVKNYFKKQLFVNFVVIKADIFVAVQIVLDGSV